LCRELTEPAPSLRVEGARLFALIARTDCFEPPSRKAILDARKEPANPPTDQIVRIGQPRPHGTRVVETLPFTSEAIRVN
jgi:hypothetical protein